MTFKEFTAKVAMGWWPEKCQTWKDREAEMEEWVIKDHPLFSETAIKANQKYLQLTTPKTR